MAIESLMRPIMTPFIEKWSLSNNSRRNYELLSKTCSLLESTEELDPAEGKRTLVSENKSLVAFMLRLFLFFFNCY